MPDATAPSPLLARVEDALCRLDLVWSVDVVPRGHVRIGTRLRYLDGSNVDLFIKDEQSAPSSTPGMLQPLTLTDFGETLMLAHDLSNGLDCRYGVDARDRRASEVARMFGASLVDDQVVAVVENPGGLGAAILALGQACMYVAVALDVQAKLAVVAEAVR